MTTVPQPRRATPEPGPVRALAFVIAAGLIGLLVGLSAARDALPGDTFQRAQRAHGPALSTGLTGDVAAHSKPASVVASRCKARHGALLAPLSPAVTVPADRAIAGPLGSTAVAAVGDLAGAVGCRGPPAHRR
jgi:hypothetical protein